MTDGNSGASRLQHFLRAKPSTQAMEGKKPEHLCTSRNHRRPCCNLPCSLAVVVVLARRCLPCTRVTGLVSIYETPGMKLIDRRVLAAEDGIHEFQWSPKANLLPHCSTVRDT